MTLTTLLAATGFCTNPRNNRRFFLYDILEVCIVNAFSLMKNFTSVHPSTIVRLTASIKSFPPKPCEAVSKHPRRQTSPLSAAVKKRKAEQQNPDQITNHCPMVAATR